jgi:hypothetical protein
MARIVVAAEPIGFQYARLISDFPEIVDRGQMQKEAAN